MKKKYYVKILSALLSLIIIISSSITSFSESTSSKNTFDYTNYSGADITETKKILKDANVNVDAYSIKLDSKEFIEFHKEQTSRSTTYINLPSYVDNQSYFPSPSTSGQGNQNSCSAWASAYFLKSGQEKINKGWSRNTTNHIFSPAYIFNTTTNGSGITLGEALIKMYSDGVCPLSYMSYNQYNYNIQPNALQNAAAELYIIKDFWTTDSIESIKRNIYLYGGACISVLTYQDFNELNSSNSVYDTIDPNDSNPGYHSICLIGYDDNISAFKFINSWANDYGLNGYGWISYNLVNNPNVNLPGAGVSFVIDYQDNNVLMGDIDNNGKITARDALYADDYVDGTESLTPKQRVLADVDGDGDVDATDVQNILSYSAHTINKFPIYN